MHKPIVGSHFKVCFDSMISYICSVAPRTSPIWGNVEHHFVIIFGLKIAHLNAYFIIFRELLCHADHYSAQDKNKFNVYSTLVINIIFMILLTQIHIIQRIFYVLSDMYIRLHIL